MKKVFYILMVITLLLAVYVEYKKAEVVFRSFSFKEFCVSFSEIVSSVPEAFLREFSISNKDKLDRAVGKYLHDWTTAGKDSANCIVYFDKVIPFEWDTLVYVKYDHYYKDSNSDALMDYMDCYLPDDKERSATELHLLHNGKIVLKVNLYMISDDAKGVFFCTKKDFIKRSRADAKFHVIKDDKFYVVRDTDEEYVPMISF